MIAMRTRTVVAVLPKSNILYQYFLIFEQKIFARTYYKAPREGVERHIFWPRQGLRTVKDLEKEKKDIDENVEENPLDIGNINNNEFFSFLPLLVISGCWYFPSAPQARTVVPHNWVFNVNKVNFYFLTTYKQQKNPSTVKNFWVRPCFPFS